MGHQGRVGWPFVAEQKQEDSAFRHLRALVVDPQPSMRNLMVDLLNDLGFVDVVAAANATDGLQTLAANRCDLVLCEYHLGANRQNGQQMLEEARALERIGPATVWIMVTGERTFGAVMGTIENQPDDYLIKPVSLDILARRLKRGLLRKRLFAGIEACIRRHDYMAAIDVCVNLGNLPDVSLRDDLMRLHAGLLFLVGDLENARELCRRALEVRPSAWASAGLARIHLARREYGEARALLTALVQDSPQYMEAYDLLVRALHESGEHEAAYEWVRKAVRLSPNVGARQDQLGAVALACADYSEAARAFRKAITLNTHSVHRSASPLVGLARVHLARDQEKEAFALLRDVREQFPDKNDAAVQAALERAAIYQRQGNPGMALEELAFAARGVTEAEGRIEPATAIAAARELLTMGETARARALFEEIVRNNHDNHALLLDVQAAWTVVGLADEGAALVRAVSQQAADMNNAGVRLVREGALRTAVDSLRRAATAMPNNTVVLLNYARALVLYMQETGANDEHVRVVMDIALKARRLDINNEEPSVLMRAITKLPRQAD